MKKIFKKKHEKSFAKTGKQFFFSKKQHYLK